MPTTTGGIQLKKKRGLSSSPATSSSHRRKIKLRRPLLIHRRGGGGTTSTPAPMWKANVGLRSPCSDGIAGRNCRSPEVVVVEGAEGVVSARKLVSVLWQLSNDGKEREFSEISRDGVSDISSYYKAKRHRRKALEDDQRQTENSWYKEERSQYSNRNNAAMLVKSCTQQSPTNSLGDSTKLHRLTHLSSSITASREILKALIHLLLPERTQSSSTLSLFSALQSELNRARMHLNQLEKKETLRRREKEKILLGFEMVMEELEAEKRARRKVERMNQRLEMAMVQMEKSILEATGELERERRSRERVERVCKELTRGIGEDRAEVEELKRQAVGMQEELERERELLRAEIEKEKEMLQIADEWREERVQMKLAEARWQFEEKNSAVDELRNELEAYLVSKMEKEVSEVAVQEKAMNESGTVENHDDDDDEERNGHDFEEKNEAIDRLRIELETYMNAKVLEGEFEGGNSEPCDGDGESDSGDESDLQSSIELDMENGMKWDFEKIGADGADLLFDKERERMYQTDVERYNLVKGLRDNMLAAGSGIVAEKR